MNMERDHKLSDHNLDIKNIVPCDEKLNKLIDEIFENQNEKGKETETKTKNGTENVEETANPFNFEKYVQNSKEVFRLSDPAMWLMYAIMVSQKMSPEAIDVTQQTQAKTSPTSANNTLKSDVKEDFRDNKMGWAAIAIMSNFWNQVRSQKGGDTTAYQKTTNLEYKTLLEISLKNYIYGMELRMHHYVSYFAGDNTYRVAKEILKHLITESNQLSEENKPEEKSTGGKTPSGSILDVYSSIEPYLQLKEHDGGEAWSRLRAYFYKEGPPFVQNPSRLYVFGAAYVHHHHVQKNQRSPSSSFASSK